jgi:hypothetical protein
MSIEQDAKRQEGDIASLKEMLQRRKDDALAASTKEPKELTSAAIAQFEAALIRAHDFRENRSPTIDRYRANLLIRACVELINSHPAWRENKLAVPLVYLSAALADLELGAQPSLLKPVRSERGGRPSSYYDGALRASASAIMGGLMRHGGMTRRDAATWVAKQLDWRSVNWKTIAAWRKEAIEQPHGEIGERYNATLERADWTDPLICAHRLIGNIKALAPPEK